jgi:hypothetical protein
LSIVAIIVIMFSYKEFLVFLIRYNPTMDMTILRPLKPLSLTFILDLVALFVMGVALIFGVIKGKRK